MVYHKTIPQVELKTSRGGGLVFYREITGGFCVFFHPKKCYMSTILNHISHLGGFIMAFST